MRLEANTLEAHWMPFTANRDFKRDPRLLVRAQGMYYWSHRGHRILDGCSGLFCSGLGHGRPEIAEAVRRQLLELDYSPHFQVGAPPSFELAARLARLTPEGLDRIFFVNSGSEAVDTALKIAMAYHRARGEGGRLRFVTRERAYHGVNIGGTSLAGIVRNRTAFPALMPAISHLRHTWLPQNRFTRGQPAEGAELADDLQRIVDTFGAETIAAVFVEPVAGSTGCLVPPAGYLERLRAICDRYGILLVFDEVICGFGRLGAPFGAQAFAVVPDMILMAKTLTNGAQPMGAVAVREDIYRTVVEAAPLGSIELFHGHTYSGHPAACAAALATLEIFEREEVIARARALSEPFLDMLFALRELDVVTDIRGYGLFGAFDLEPGPVAGARGYETHKRLFDAGLLLKWTGDTALVAPPLVASEEEIAEIGRILRQVLADMAQKWRAQGD